MATLLPPETDDITPEEPAGRFPHDFLWGAATSAYQIEGSVRAGGRGESIWDRFAHTPGRTRGGDTGDVACDHYRRLDGDLDLIATLGLKAYRFSVAWPRVQPEGWGPANPEGLRFYHRLVEGLLERGVVPLATLYHWDLPQSLQDRGGWAERDTASRFADYAEVVAGALGDVVPIWITHNEPWVAAFLGYGTGVHAPGIRHMATAFRAAHHLLLSHGLGMDAIRSVAPSSTQAAIALNLYRVDAQSDEPGDVEAARRMDGWQNRWFLDAVLTGSYPQDVLGWYEGSWGAPDWLRDGDLAIISRPLDLLGVNFYSRHLVGEGGPDDPLEIRAAAPRLPTTAMGREGWEVVPDALTDVLVRLRREYGELPVCVTENGAAYDDPPPDRAGRVHDPDRVDYLRRHVEAVARASDAGVDVRGYFAWSLMDNFEWAEGFSKRFGLIHVDFETQRRTLKDSARWYRELIAAGGS
jgi:beta-glucosidase